MVSVNGLSRDEYLEFSGFGIKFDEYVRNLQHFCDNRKQCEVYIKISGDHIPPERIEKFYKIFGDMGDRVFVEHTAPVWPQFSVRDVNQKVGIYNNPLTNVKVCPYIFYSLTVNWDGTISLCFVDWNQKMIVGDLKTQSFKSVWEGEHLRQYRLVHLSGQRSALPQCGNCGQLTHCAPRDIDKYAEKFRRIYEN
jgi:radical SAM protein with 4Fe4S-binding SPASM domain